MKFIAYAIVYATLFIFGIKFYLWSRCQQKKYQKKWALRMGTFLFFAPLFLFLIELCLPVPKGISSALHTIIGSVDSTLAWIKGLLRPMLGIFGYALVKPIITAFVYMALGLLVGTGIDAISKNDKNSE